MSEHNHGQAHAHAPANFNKAFAIGIALNIAFVVVRQTHTRTLAVAAPELRHLGLCQQVIERPAKLMGQVNSTSIMPSVPLGV